MFERAHPSDQADGLRRLFAASRVRFVPLVSNPHVAFGSVLIERLIAAFAGLSAHVLVVDAAERSPEPSEMAMVDLTAAVETLSDQASYLAARGLPRRFVDTTGSCGGLLGMLADAAPQADVVLVHAAAPDLVRLFAGRAVRPIVLASDHPLAVTHAYGGIKLLAQRARLMAHDLLLAASLHSPRTDRIVQQMASCADLFLGAAQRDCAVIDPAAQADAPPTAALRRLARDVLIAHDAGSTEPAVPLHGAARAMAAEPRHARH